MSNKNKTEISHELESMLRLANKSFSHEEFTGDILDNDKIENGTACRGVPEYPDQAIKALALRDEISYNEMFNKILLRGLFDELMSRVE